MVMMQRYPSFTFLFKPHIPATQSTHGRGSNGGHAHSMNIMWRLVTTRYLIYLEDDWLLRSDDTMGMHPAWMNAMRLMNRQHRKAQLPSIVGSNGDDDDGGDDGLPIIAHFYSIIVTALSILGFEGSVHVPMRDSYASGNHSIIKLSQKHLDSSRDEKHYDSASGNHHHHHHHHMDGSMSSRRVSVHQVLFNEQGSRDCAIGSHQCNDPSSQLGFGGWEILHNIIVTTTSSAPLPSSSSSSSATDTDLSLDITIPYSLHEFGLAALSSEAFHNHRNHEFSYWPGFSFNPGIWDIHAIRRALMRCMDSENANDDDDDDDGGGDVFDESDHGFEHKFSLLAYEAGLNMAYLPMVVFEEISRGHSAYRLNNISRPWE